MSETTNFPAFLQLNYDENGASAKFERDIRSMTQSAEQRFKASASEIDRAIDQALSRPRNTAGALDLGVDELRQAAQAAKLRATAAEEMSRAIRSAALAEGDFSQASRLSQAAANSLAVEQREAARAAMSQATAAEQVQAQLNKAATATTKLSIATRNSNLSMTTGAKSLGAQRFAMIQVGQQLQDIQVGFAGGQRAATIFAQQLPQLGFALSGLQGRLGAVGSFLAGPWGVAVFAAVSAAGFLIEKLYSSGEAAEAAELAANGLSSAQSVLGDIFDQTSGKIASQNALLIANARLQAINLRSEALAARERARSVSEGAGNLGIGKLAAKIFSGDISPIGAEEATAINQFRDALTIKNKAARNKSLTDVLLRSEGLNFDDIGVDAKDFREAIVGQISADEKDKIAGLIDESLNRGSLASEFRKSGPKKRTKSGKDEAKAAAREAARLSSLSDRAAESIARVNEQFDEQPRLVDRSAQAVRKLDALLAEINSPKNIGNDGKSKVPGAERITKDLEEARKLAANAVNTEIGRYIEGNEKNLQILDLQAAGLFDQAEILQEINRLDERYGLTVNLEKYREIAIEARNILEDETATAAERAKATKDLEASAAAMEKINGQQARIAENARVTHEATKERAQEIGRITQALNDQLNVVDEIEQSLTGLIGGQVSGKEFLSDIKSTFRDLQAKTTFQSIFGDSFDQIRAQLERDNTPLGRANARLAEDVDETGRVANEASEAFAAVGNAAISAAAALNAVANPTAIGSAANDNRIIKVDGIRKAMAIETRSVAELADAISGGIVGPLAASLDEIFGTRFSQQLSGALSSALSGYMQGGEVGGVLGALRGATFEFGPDVFGKGLTDKLLSGLEGGIAGAGTGTQVAGIAKALGLGGSFSTTGSQIGGAIGSVIPIPGGEIIGSTIGGLIGGLFKKTPDGNLGITGIDSRTQVRSSKAYVGENLNNLGDSLTQSIQKIADALGAEVGTFSVSLGQRNDYYRVGADANFDAGQKHPTGALYDGTDPEEAMRIALLNALQDGAIAGIREGAQRLLRAGKDIDAAIQDVLSFNSVFDRLKAYKDPVGAALDALDKEFNKLVDIFDRAGASAAEYADLEELYGIERAQAVKEASDRITGSLRDLFKDLTIGDSGLSLRTRLGNAQGEYDPLAQRVAAGDVTAYDDYAAAARNLLDLQREVYGSSEDYFQLLDEVTNLTKTRIDEESNITALAVDRDTPFSVDQTPVVDAISFQNGLISYQTDLLASYLAAISKNGTVTFDGGSAGGGRREPINRNVVNF
tara:strand:+ start:11655 stop:15512 length:3858 start_codon:yes stop_codon:yes gene_type:complete